MAHITTPKVYICVFFKAFGPSHSFPNFLFTMSVSLVRPLALFTFQAFGPSHFGIVQAFGPPRFTCQAFGPSYPRIPLSTYH